MRAREATWADLWEEAKHADILAVAERLDAKLKHTGADWVGPCPNGCARTDGFVVSPKKGKTGIFLCRPSGASGDVIVMVEHVQGCTATEAGELITGRPRADRSRDESPKERDARLERNVRLAAEAEARADKQRAAEEEKARRTAQRIRDIIREIGPVRGSPVERFLRVERKIDTDAISDVLERTDAVGWHPGMPFYETDHPLNGKKLGCTIGIMTDPVTALPTGAISRTYLHDGKKVGKAKSLGEGGGVVRLSPDDEVTQGLHLAEGLESALSAAVLGFRPIWSTGSTSILAKFPVLSGIEALTVFADNDANGAGERAANEVASRWLQAGHKARVIVWDGIGDINDALRAGGDEP